MINKLLFTLLLLISVACTPCYAVTTVQGTVTKGWEGLWDKNSVTYRDVVQHDRNNFVQGAIGVTVGIIKGVGMFGEFNHRYSLTTGESSPSASAGVRILF